MGFRPAKFRQTLGCFLLLMIIYGATVEAAHSHGAVSTDNPGIATISDAGGSHSGTNDSHYRECAMCQFQQQLLHGLAHAPLSTLTPSTQTTFASTLTVLHLLSPTTRPS